MLPLYWELCLLRSGCKLSSCLTGPGDKQGALHQEEQGGKLGKVIIFINIKYSEHDILCDGDSIDTESSHTFFVVYVQQ